MRKRSAHRASSIRSPYRDNVQTELIDGGSHRRFCLFRGVPEMITLARKLRLIDYFSLGFGTMVGTGWLVVMDDILQRGGPLGAILGFTGGALVLLPIGYVYGKLVKLIPDAAGEVAYTARVFPSGVSFVTGWMMFLAYLLTCPFEALAAGRIIGYLFPTLNSIELYRLGNHSVYLPHIVLGLIISGFFCWLNYYGIHASAKFQIGR